MNVLRNLARAFANPRLARKFFTLVGLIVVSFMIVAGTGALAFLRVSAGSGNPFEPTPPPQTPPPAGRLPLENAAAPPDLGGNPAEAAEPPAEVSKTTFLIVGEDAGASLTDVILVACLNRGTGELNVLSIPRDTRIELPQDTMRTMRELGLHPPASGTLKINAINSYGGPKYGLQLLAEEIYDLLGARIDYYAEIRLDAFRKIVDAVDGVDMTIPKGGFYYSDPEQNLTITIPGGPQHLNGKMAEGVVRYRAAYSGGDVQRIGVQQEFMKQFFSQVIKKDVLMKNAVSFITTVMGYVRTDFGLTDIPGLLPVIDKLSAESVNFRTLPGEGRYIGAVSYFIPDYSQFQDMADEVFFMSAKAANAEDADAGVQ